MSTKSTASTKASYPISAMQAPELLEDIMRAHLVPMLVSSPGIGKSSIIHQLAAKLDLLVIDLRLSACDPTDLNGFPSLSSDRTRAGYVPMEMFPLAGQDLPIKYSGQFYVNGKPVPLWVMEDVKKPKAGEPKQVIKTDADGKNVPQRYKGWILFLDEMNSAPPAVQAASYKLVLDHMVGQVKLHKKCWTVAAGNLSTDKAIVNRMSTAMQSRMIWLHLEVDVKAWQKWANEEQVDYRVRSFVAYRPSSLSDFKPDHCDHTFTCARTLHFLSDIIKPWKTIERNKMPIIAGTIGEGNGREFLAFCSIYKDMITIEDMLADPDGVAIPTKNDIKWALTGLIAEHIDSNNADKLMVIINKLGVEFQVLCLQGAYRKDPLILQNPDVLECIKKFSEYMAA